MKRIFAVGSLNMDLVIRAPYMPENGETLTGGGFMTNPGGKGANQAAAIAKLGGSAFMVGCVGEAFGAELKAALSGYGVNVEYVEELKGVSSGIAVIVVVDGDNRIILDAGANARVGVDLIRRALANAKAGDYLVCQLEISLDMVEAALREGKRRGMITVLNPAPARELPRAVYENCDYIIPNRSEAEILTGIRPTTDESILAVAARFSDMGAKNTLVTLGSDGSAFVGGGKVLRAPCYPAEAVDTTAAGDTWIGALVTRLAEGADISEAMRFAAKAAAITVTRRGAQQSIPTRAEVG